MNARLAYVVCVVILSLVSGQPDPPNVSRPASASALQLNPDKIDFGSQPVGVKSQPQTATLTNTGKATISIRDITASGIDFGESDTCDNALPPGAQCSITTTFAPAISGPRLGTVIVTDSEPATAFLVLTGTGN